MTPSDILTTLTVISLWTAASLSPVGVLALLLHFKPFGRKKGSDPRKSVVIGTFGKAVRRG